MPPRRAVRPPNRRVNARGGTGGWDVVSSVTSDRSTGRRSSTAPTLRRPIGRRRPSVASSAWNAQAPAARGGMDGRWTAAYLGDAAKAPRPSLISADDREGDPCGRHTPRCFRLGTWLAESVEGRRPQRNHLRAQSSRRAGPRTHRERRAVPDGDAAPALRDRRATAVGRTADQHRYPVRSCSGSRPALGTFGTLGRIRRY